MKKTSAIPLSETVLLCSCYPRELGQNPQLRSARRCAPTESRFLEVSCLPDPLREISLHIGHVGIGRRGVPATGIPSAHATPLVAGCVRLAVRHIVEPPLVTLKAGTPNRVGSVSVKSSRLGDSGPRCLLVWPAVLQDTPALRALARGSIDTKSVPGRTLRRIG